MKKLLFPSLTAVLFLLILIFIHPVSSWAAPKANLWDFWLSHNESSTVKADHSYFNTFLKAYVVTDKDGINKVMYDRVSKRNHEALMKYIADLSNIKVRSLNRKEQLAYWINLYNALTIDVILDHYPVKSIRDIDISPGIFADGPWGKKLVTIEGQPVSLDDIEHRILRPIWKDPRIHYAVNCASLGCPNLQNTAFTSENTEALLEKGAKDYINHPRGVEVIQGQLHVSNIYDWFKEDFGGTDKGVIEHLRKYASPNLAFALEKATSIAKYDYDWSLNGLE